MDSGPILVLFDIDGTLLLCGGAGMRSMARVSRRLFGARFIWDGIEPAGGLDPLLLRQALTLNGIESSPALEERFRHAYLKELAGELADERASVRLMPGIRRLLDGLRARKDVVLGLLTGNYAEAAPLKLAAVDLDPSWFVVNAFGGDGPSRADLVASALDRYQRRFGLEAQRERVVLVGDTPVDVEAARAHGCRVLAVATGRYDIFELAPSRPDRAVRDLADPGPLFELMGLPAD